MGEVTALGPMSKTQDVHWICHIIVFSCMIGHASTKIKFAYNYLGGFNQLHDDT